MAKSKKTDPTEKRIELQRAVDELEKEHGLQAIINAILRHADSEQDEARALANEWDGVCANLRDAAEAVGPKVE